MAQGPSARRIQERLPEGTRVYGNIPYHGDSLDKHLLDLYLPADTQGPYPLVVLIHGGGWISNDKYADMGYMPQTIADLLNQGLAIASIDYRFATEAVFPGILQDCNMAVSFLYDQADTYGLDVAHIALMGFSAGGHLAALMGTSQNNQVEAFYVAGSYRPFAYRAVVDYYGPTDLVLLPGNEDPNSPEAILIGAQPLLRPDLARAASPITYLDPDDPPFLIFHGEADKIVSNKQSKLLSAWLEVHGVEHTLTIVPDAPHFGPMYDVEAIRAQVMAFLGQYLR
ncbi:MAG: alpha/beta hydrolase [Bacteroidetes bacterium]|nr:MAG: alpha/beta hydrolase [Bacteroidota bacterium]